MEMVYGVIQKLKRENKKRKWYYSLSVSLSIVTILVSGNFQRERKNNEEDSGIAGIVCLCGGICSE